MVLFGSIIASKCDFVPATVSTIIAVVVLFLLYDLVFLRNSNNKIIISNTKCLNCFIVMLDIISIAILLIQITFAINHPNDIPFFTMPMCLTHIHSKSLLQDKCF